MNPAEGWNNRRRWKAINIDAPSLTDRILADLVANPGAMSLEIALRLSAVEAVTAASVGSRLQKLHLDGRVQRGGKVGAYQWAIPGVLIRIRDGSLPRSNAARLSQAAETRRRRQALAESLNDLERLLRRMHPGRVTRHLAASELRWREYTARSRLAELVRQGRAVVLRRNGVSTGRYGIPGTAAEVVRAAPAAPDNDTLSPPSGGDCEGLG